MEIVTKRNYKAELLTTEKEHVIKNITGRLIEAEERNWVPMKSYLYSHFPELKSQEFQAVLSELVSGNPLDTFVTVGVRKISFYKNMEDVLMKYDPVFLNSVISGEIMHQDCP